MPINIYSTNRITDEVNLVSHPFRALQILIYKNRPLAIATLVYQNMQVANYSTNTYMHTEFHAFEMLFREKFGTSNERITQFDDVLAFLIGLSRYGYTWGLSHAFSD